MKRKVLLVLGLGLSLTGLASCTSGANPGPDNQGGTVTPTKEIKVNFELDETLLSVCEKDDLSKKVVGDNFRFTLLLQEGTKIISVIANSKELTPIGANRYSFKLVEGENYVKVNSISTISPFKEEKMEINPNATTEKLYSNWGFPHFPTTGEQKLLVIPVSIKGHEKNATQENKDKIEKAFFGDSSNTYFESVSSFYEKSSYGKLKITGTVTDWFEIGATEEEILSEEDSQFNDNGIFYLSNKAIEWVKTNYADTINLDEYDNNDDGFIDGIYFIYSAFDALTVAPENQDLLELRWNHTFYNIRNSTVKASKESPIPMTYSWSSFNMVNRASKNKADAHTYIHEFGHQLGLDDYYDTTIQQGKAYTSPMGGLDMMDYNIGDHSMYSKFALGRTAPKKISGNSGSIEVTLEPSYINGDFAIIAGDEYNGLPFDEYIAIEYLSNENDKKNLNYFDSVNPYPVTVTTDGSKVTTYGESGIRVTHIDARAIDKDVKYTDDIDKMIKTKFSNTGSTKDGYRDPKTNNNYVLTTLISANTNRNVQGTMFTANSSDLFKANDSFTFKPDVPNTYSNCLPSLTNKLNDGTKTNYIVKVKSLDASKAVIEIKAN